MRKMTQEVYRQWKRWEEKAVKDADTAKELLGWKQETEKIGEWKNPEPEEESPGSPKASELEAQITECFYKDLEFGTGGLRGIIGAGTNRMNVYTVARASGGYARYLEGLYSGREGIEVVIAYDSRRKSTEFAKAAAEVFAAAGIRVHLFRELMPTPVLSYAVPYLGCSGGVVITASHNPAEYNGYKVYGRDGGQITGEAAESIFAEIQKLDIFDDVKRLPFEEAVEQGKISFVPDSLLDAFIKDVSHEAFGGEIDRNIKIVYSPLNGTGLKPVCRVLEEYGFSDVHVVEEQKDPDGKFPTCPVPNPEKKEALTLALRDAERLDADLVLSTDPDCDRVGIAVKSAKGYCLLSGNETGILLLDYICRRRRETGKMPDDPLAFKTIVTTDLAAEIAEGYDVEMRNVLTGFKYIGEQIGLLESAGEKGRFILGIEESYGYLTGTYVRDKDGVDASLMICEMAGYHKAKGHSLLEVLDGIYEKYGYYLNTQHTYSFPGKDGIEKMRELMESYRGNMRTFPACCGLNMIQADDYKTSKRWLPDGRILPIDLPPSNVVKFIWEDGTSIAVRPSGTEPKLKVYIQAVGKSREKAEEKERVLKEWLKVL